MSLSFLPELKEHPLAVKQDAFLLGRSSTDLYSLVLKRFPKPVVGYELGFKIRHTRLERKLLKDLAALQQRAHYEQSDWLKRMGHRGSWMLHSASSTLVIGSAQEGQALMQAAAQWQEKCQNPQSMMASTMLYHPSYLSKKNLQDRLHIGSFAWLQDMRAWQVSFSSNSSEAVSCRYQARAWVAYWLSLRTGVVPSNLDSFSISMSQMRTWQQEWSDPLTIAMRVRHSLHAYSVFLAYLPTSGKEQLFALLMREGLFLVDLIKDPRYFYQQSPQVLIHVALALLLLVYAFGHPELSEPWEENFLDSMFLILAWGLAELRRRPYHTKQLWEVFKGFMVLRSFIAAGHYQPIPALESCVAALGEQIGATLSEERCVNFSEDLDVPPAQVLQLIDHVGLTTGQSLNQVVKLDSGVVRFQQGAVKAFWACALSEEPATHRHAALGALELWLEEQPIFVSCGAADAELKWEEGAPTTARESFMELPFRSSVAYSSLTLDDRNLQSIQPLKPSTNNYRDTQQEREFSWKQMLFDVRQLRSKFHNKRAKDLQDIRLIHPLSKWEVFQDTVSQTGRLWHNAYQSRYGVVIQQELKLHLLEKRPHPSSCFQLSMKSQCSQIKTRPNEPPFISPKVMKWRLHVHPKVELIPLTENRCLLIVSRDSIPTNVRELEHKREPSYRQRIQEDIHRGSWPRNAWLLLLSSDEAALSIEESLHGVRQDSASKKVYVSTQQLVLEKIWSQASRDQLQSLSLDWTLRLLSAKDLTLLQSLL